MIAVGNGHLLLYGNTLVASVRRQGTSPRSLNCRAAEDQRPFLPQAHLAPLRRGLFLSRDLREVQVHRFGIAGRQDQGCALALLRANRTEDVGGGGTLVTRCAWAGAALRPATGDLVLLSDTSLVGEPDFYRVAVERLRARDFFQAQWEAFLKSSIAPCACAWWRGRAESLR